MKKFSWLFAFTFFLLNFSCSKSEESKSKQITDPNITIESIANRYIDAIGGPEAINKIQSIEFNALAEVDGKPLHIKITKTNKGQKIIDAKNEIGSQRIVWDGKDGYLLTQDGKTELSPWSKKELENSKLLFPETEFAQRKDLKLIGIEFFNFEDSYEIKGKNTTYYYSVKTGLKTGEEMTHIIDGKEKSIPTEYGNYKSVSGVKLPYSFTENLDTKRIRYRINDYAINEAQDKDFE